MRGRGLSRPLFLSGNQKNETFKGSAAISLCSRKQGGAAPHSPPEALMRNRYIFIISALIIAVGLAHWLYVGFLSARPPAPMAPGEPDTRWYSANPKASHFTISTADELAGLAAVVNGTWKGKRDGFQHKTIALAADIDLSAYPNWVPIGSGHLIPGRYSEFRGTFDGHGHIVRNLSINRPDASHQGLFGLVYAAEVMNIGVENVNIKGGEYVGGVAGSIDSNSGISNCYSTGAVGGSRAVGGIVGSVGAGSTVFYCYSLAEVAGEGDQAGGIAGHIYEGKVSACYSTGRVSGAHEAGGIAGAVKIGSVVHCAALNPQVKGWGESTTGRVAGYISDKLRATAIDSLGESILANNIAYDRMIINAAAVDTSLNRKGAHRIDGANITIYEINTYGTFHGRFVAMDGWTTSPGSLPGLFGRTVPMPGYLLFAGEEQHKTRKRVRIKRVINGSMGAVSFSYPEAAYTIGEQPVWARHISEYDAGGNLVKLTSCAHPEGAVEYSAGAIDAGVIDYYSGGLNVKNWKYLDDRRITDMIDTLKVEVSENGLGGRVLVYREEGDRVRIFELADSL